MGFLQTVLAILGLSRDHTITQVLQHWLTRDIPLRDPRPRYIQARCGHCGTPLAQPPVTPGEDSTDVWRCPSQWKCRSVVYLDLPDDQWRNLMSGWLDPDRN